MQHRAEGFHVDDVAYPAVTIGLGGRVAEEVKVVELVVPDAGGAVGRPYGGGVFGDDLADGRLLQRVRLTRAPRAAGGGRAFAGHQDVQAVVVVAGPSHPVAGFAADAAAQRVVAPRHHRAIGISFGRHAVQFVIAPSESLTTQGVRGQPRVEHRHPPTRSVVGVANNVEDDHCQDIIKYGALHSLINLKT